MRRSTTLLELVLVLATVGILVGITIPHFQSLADGLAVHAAVLDIVSAHQRARMSAILRSRALELTVGPDELILRARGDTTVLWRAPGPAARQVTLAGPPHTMMFSPVGVTFGLSNASFRLSRGGIVSTVVVSRLGRVRTVP
jgi:Tfp pilus assembly major pilin PilA